MKQPRHVLGDVTNSISGLKSQSTQQPMYARPTRSVEDSLNVEPWAKDCEPVSTSGPDMLLTHSIDSTDRYEDLHEKITSCAGELFGLWMQSATTRGHRISCVIQRFRALEPLVPPAFFFCPHSITIPPLGDDAQVQVERITEKLQHVNLSKFPATRGCIAVDFDDKENKKEDVFDTFDEFSIGVSFANRKSLEPMISPDSVLRNFRDVERETTLLWLFQVCATVNIEDAVLHTTVLLLDRYSSVQSDPIPSETLQLVTVAIISISLKLHGDEDERSKPPKLQDFLIYLGHHRFSALQIFAKEHEVLRDLGFSVQTPLAVDYLDVFLLPYRGHGEVCASPQWCLSKLLLQLSLLDASLHYRYCPVVLAAGAVYGALRYTQMGPDHTARLANSASLFYKQQLRAIRSDAFTWDGSKEFQTSACDL